MTPPPNPPTTPTTVKPFPHFDGQDPSRPCPNRRPAPGGLGNSFQIKGHRPKSLHTKGGQRSLPEYKATQIALDIVPFLGQGGPLNEGRGLSTHGSVPGAERRSRRPILRRWAAMSGVRWSAGPSLRRRPPPHPVGECTPVPEPPSSLFPGLPGPTSTLRSKRGC